MVDTNELSRLMAEARKETKNNEQIISDYIQALTDKKLVVRSSYNYYEYSQLTEVSVWVEFFDESKGRTDFGSNFDIHFKASSDGTYTFKQGCGTCGSYSRKEAPYQIDRMRLMLNIWDREKELVELFDNLPYEANKAAERLLRQKDREDAEAERIAREKKEQEVKAKIKVGYTFSDSNKRESFEYTITKITPKRVYLEYTSSFELKEYVWEDDTYLREKNVLKHVKSSGYIEYDLFVNLLTDLGSNLSRTVESYMKGASWISTTEEEIDSKN